MNGVELRNLSRCERGGIRGSLVNLLVGLILFAAAFFWAWRHWHSPHLAAPSASNRVPSIPVSIQSDPAEATGKLLKALNQKLADLDLLKLLSEEVQVYPVTVQGKVVNAYREKFRLPDRYSSRELAGWLEEAVRPLGARLRSMPSAVLGGGGTTSYSCPFVYDDRWVPVELDFIKTGSPRLCLIIDDAGYQRGETLGFLYGLKVPVTVAIIPDGEFSNSLAGEFPDHGVEVMCHMPMEGHEKGMVGSNYKELLKKGMGATQAEKMTEEALGVLPNVRGLNNHMGSVATVDGSLMEGVCQALKARGLYAIDSRTTAQSVVEKTARKVGVPTTHRDVFLDNVETPQAILKQLNQAASYAKRHGTAVAIGHFKATTLKALADAIPLFKDKGIQFVYASEVVK